MIRYRKSVRSVQDWAKHKSAGINVKVFSFILLLRTELQDENKIRNKPQHSDIITHYTVQVKIHTGHFEEGFFFNL